MLVAAADECHYEFGAKRFAETYAKVQQLAHMLGYNKNRLEYETISEKNTEKFVEIVKNYTRKFK